jgi:bifunctional DNase/RNase
LKETYTGNRLYKVRHVQPFQEFFQDATTGIGAVLFGLRLYLEDNKKLTLVNIPPEIAATIARINSGEAPPERQSIFDILANNEKFRDVFYDLLEKVIIDELNTNTGLYNAKAVFTSEGVTLSVKMIPSHAIFLALVLDKPIYVTEELVRLEEEEFEDDEFEDEEF